MGLKLLTKRDSQFFFVFLLIVSQIIIFGLASSAIITSNDNHKSTVSPIDDDSFEVNDVQQYCFDLAVLDDLVMAQTSRGFDFLDISDPENPTEISINSTVNNYEQRFTIHDKTMLISLYDSRYNHNLLKFDLNNLTGECEVIDVLRGGPVKMILTNDTLYYAHNIINYYTFAFQIYNATNLDNLALLGNSTISGLNLNDHDSLDCIVHENYVYFRNDQDNLLVYQINSTYQLEFIREYSFLELYSMYFHGNYFFTCDKQSLQVFDYSDPGNLAYVSHYNISLAKNIRFINNIACLVSNEAFTTLDLSNINSISTLDQYTFGFREDCEFRKVETSGNLAIVLTEGFVEDTLSSKYTGYLYIFDVTTPDKIDRVYPKRFPLFSGFDMWVLGMIALCVVLPITFVVVTIIVIVRVVKKRKLQNVEIVDNNT